MESCCYFSVYYPQEYWGTAYIPLGGRRRSYTQQVLLYLLGMREVQNGMFSGGCIDEKCKAMRSDIN